MENIAVIKPKRGRPRIWETERWEKCQIDGFKFKSRRSQVNFHLKMLLQQELAGHPHNKWMAGWTDDTLDEDTEAVQGMNVVAYDMARLFLQIADDFGPELAKKEIHSYVDYLWDNKERPAYWMRQFIKLLRKDWKEQAFEKNEEVM